MFLQFFIFVTFFLSIFALHDSSNMSTTIVSNSTDSGLKTFASFFESIGKMMSATAKNVEKSSFNNNSSVFESNDTNSDPKLKIVSTFFESVGKMMTDAANEQENLTTTEQNKAGFGGLNTLMTFFNNMGKIQKEFDKYNLTQDSLTDASWKNYSFGPIHDLSKTEIFQNVFGDFSVNATSFNYSTKIDNFKPEEFEIGINDTKLHIKAEHVEKFGDGGISTMKFTKSVPLPEGFTMKDIKYEFDDKGTLFICGDLRFECKLIQNKPVLNPIIIVNSKHFSKIKEPIAKL